MIVGFIDMIRRCIARAREGNCASCDRRPNCAAARWQRAFAAETPAAAPVPKPNAKPLLALLGGIAEALGGQASPPARSFRAEVERLLEPLLASGDASVERVARELGCSRQTLYRRLRGEGVTFEQVLEELRRRLARRYIERDGLAVKQAAWRLGFSDPAAFSRAFKRWTGRSPSRARA